jgi:tetratricopeptide (TPR) repeat protein
MAFAYYAGGLSENSSANAEKVREIVNKALELDPNLAEAYVSRGFVSGVYDWDFRASEKDYLRAIELEPNNDTAHWLYAMNLSNRGRIEEALAEIETAMTIDPGATMYKEHRGRILYYARRYDQAIKQFQQVIDLDDRPNQPYAGLSRIYEIKGDYASAYQFFLKKEERSPRKDRLEIYKKNYETAGWMGVRRELAESLEYNFFDLARLYALRDEKDAAFEALNRSFEKREWYMVTLKVEPAFDNLRGDPRFDELLGRIGLK